MATAFFTVTGTEDLTRRLLEIGQDAPRAAVRSVNRTLVSLRTFAARGLTARLGVPQKLVRSSLWTWKAKINDQTGTFRVGQRRLPLVKLTASQRASDVTFRYRKEFRHMPAASPPFRAKMESGHVGIFVRSTRPAEHRGGDPRFFGRGYPGSWLPIGEVYGPPISDVFERDLRPAALTKANDDLAKNLNHEIGEILRKRVQAGDD